MSPLCIVASLFWLMTICGVGAFVSDPPSFLLLKASWRSVGLIILATALWRVPWDGIFFHGLEYEDSYVYTVEGRQLAERSAPIPVGRDAPFSFSVCEIGSLTDCEVWEPFPEHLIGYPYVIAVASHAVGYSPSVGSIINVGASMASAVLVFLLAFALTGDALVAQLAGMSYALIPVFAVYGLETSAEPFSSCCLLLALWFFLRLWQEPSRIPAQLLNWCGYTCTLLFCQTVKREDALLAVILPLLIPLVLQRHTGAFLAKRRAIVMVLLTSAFALGLSLKMHLFQTSEAERELLHQFPLTAARLMTFIGSFLSSFLIFGWYGGSFLAVLAAIIVSVRRRSLARIPVILLIAFIVVYASHIRGYYEMESGRVSKESALRFSMNFMGLWSLAVGLGLGWAVRFVHKLELVRSRTRVVRNASLAMGAVIVIASGITTYFMRRDAVEDETNGRILPALLAAEAELFSEARLTYVLTMDPLVVQMYAGTEARIVDLESLDMPTLERLLDSRAKLLLLKQNDRFMDADVKRYGEPIRRVLNLPSRQLRVGDGFTVSAIEPKGNAKYH